MKLPYVAFARMDETCKWNYESVRKTEAWQRAARIEARRSQRAGGGEA